MKQIEVITGTGVPQSHLPFSPAIKAGDYVFISGQASVDDEGKIVNGTFAEECRRSFENLGFLAIDKKIDLSLKIDD